ncbi:MAG: hypothetical protein L3J83_02695 [Proteobacteria bacterium]|nr:hypothetical protein [Pseudomonadota bacterium]
MKKTLFILSVLVINTACSDIIEVEDISNKTVTLLAPTNEAVLNIIDLTFTWQTVEDAESYRIQIARPTFEEAVQIVKDTTVVSTSFSTSLEANSYEWRVRAENSAYETAFTTQSFTIEE